MESSIRYVPVLRYKDAELGALKDFASVYRANQNLIAPIVEPVPSKFERSRRGEKVSVDSVLDEIAKDIATHWGWYSPVYIDNWLLEPEMRSDDDINPLERLFNSMRSKRALGINIQAVPVTGLDKSRYKDYQNTVRKICRKDNLGLGVRILRDDLTKQDFSKQLLTLVKELEIEPEMVDLFIDYQLITSTTSSILEFNEICNLIPSIDKWRSFTVISGAFPPDLANFNPPGVHEHIRADWLMWHDHYSKHRNLVRRPDYGDYTIQHPYFHKQKEYACPSASIRYTSKNKWVIVKGRSLRTPQGYNQYPANAAILCSREEYCGADYSAGDEYISQMSLEIAETESKMETGNAKTWLQAGINHHLVFVMKQLANLAVS